MKRLHTSYSAIVNYEDVTFSATVQDDSHRTQYYVGLDSSVKVLENDRRFALKMAGSQQVKVFP